MSPARQSKVIWGLGGAQTLAWGSTYYLPAILVVPMAGDLGISPDIVFAEFSAALVVAAVLGPLAGRRIDLFGGRHVLVASSSVFATGLTLLCLAPNAWVLGIAWLIIGVGMALGLYEAAFSTLAGIYGRQARSAITGITLLAGFASTLCWPISAYLEAEIGWRGVCFFWACAHIALGLPLNRFLVPPGDQAGLPARHSMQGARQFERPLYRPMALLAFVFAVTWFTSTAMATHLPRLLQEAGATPSAAIAAAALVGPAQVAGRLLEFGPLRHLHPLLSARIAAVAHPVGATAVMIFGAPAMLIFPAVHGAGNGILTIAKGTLPLAIFGPSGYGLRQGVLMVPARFGQASAPFLFGLLIERFGASALLLSTALGLVALVALLTLSPLSMADQQ